MNGVIWYVVALHCIEWHAMLLDGGAWHGGHDVAWYGTRLHCTGCMALHCISLRDIAWHDLAVLIIHTHCCWDSHFGVLPQRLTSNFALSVQDETMSVFSAATSTRQRGVFSDLWIAIFHVSSMFWLFMDLYQGLEVPPIPLPEA